MHVGLIFGDLPSVLSYLLLIQSNFFELRSVPLLLRLAALMCTHTSSEAQVKEIWHILNPLFDQTINAADLMELIELYVHLSVDTTLAITERFTSDNAFEVSMKTEAVKYLTNSSLKKDALLQDFKAKVPDQIGFAEFCDLISGFLSPGQIRMAIFGKESSQVGIKLAKSNASTVVLEFLSQQEMV